MTVRFIRKTVSKIGFVRGTSLIMLGNSSFDNLINDYIYVNACSRMAFPQKENI